ncbi:hypothetical protein [Gorillibacterium sp. CAU 1737]|uniref:hypothetical protein n=1 Tax=Gorillibacterium sp. CAU 1737 TaxID=3140362 RepID=UPI0032614088
MAVAIFLSLVLVAGGVGWVKLFDIRLRPERIILFGLLLILAGIGFGTASVLGLILLITGLATGILGFFSGSDRSDSSGDPS